MNATARGDTLDDVVRAYAGDDLAGCIFTKVDEAASLAPARCLSTSHPPSSSAPSTSTRSLRRCSRCRSRVAPSAVVSLSTARSPARARLRVGRHLRGACHDRCRPSPATPGVEIASTATHRCVYGPDPPHFVPCQERAVPSLLIPTSHRKVEDGHSSSGPPANFAIALDCPLPAAWSNSGFALSGGRLCRGAGKTLRVFSHAVRHLRGRRRRGAAVGESTARRGRSRALRCATWPGRTVGQCSV